MTIPERDLEIASQILRSPVGQLNSGIYIAQNELEVLNSIHSPQPPSPSISAQVANLPGYSGGSVAPTVPTSGLINYYTNNPHELSSITQLNPTPVQNRQASAPPPREPFFTERGIITLIGMLSASALILTAMVKIWGTTDVAQQQRFLAQQEAHSAQVSADYAELLATAEEVSRTRSVCILAFRCPDSGSNSRSRSSRQAGSLSPARQASLNQQATPIAASTYTSAQYEKAAVEVHNWKNSGVSLEKANQYINTIAATPNTGYPPAEAMKQAVVDIYR